MRRRCLRSIAVARRYAALARIAGLTYEDLIQIGALAVLEDRAVRWKIIDTLRQLTRNRRGRAHLHRTVVSLDAGLAATIRDTKAGPEELLLQAEAHQELAQAVGGLTGHQREVMGQRLQGRTNGLIARTFGVSESAIEKTVERSIRRLRQQLTRQYLE